MGRSALRATHWGPKGLEKQGEQGRWSKGVEGGGGRGRAAWGKRAGRSRAALQCTLLM